MGAQHPSHCLCPGAQRAWTQPPAPAPTGKPAGRGPEAATPDSLLTPQGRASQGLGALAPAPSGTGKQSDRATARAQLTAGSHSLCSAHLLGHMNSPQVLLPSSAHFLQLPRSNPTPLRACLAHPHIEAPTGSVPPCHPCRISICSLPASLPGPDSPERMTAKQQPALGGGGVPGSGCAPHGPPHPALPLSVA